MLEVFRVTKSQYIMDKKGEGSFRYGGRWVPEGYRVLHASDSRALAFCECMANLGFSPLPHKLALMQIHIPAAVKVKTVQMKELSRNWTQPSSIECRRIGEAWLIEGKFAVLKVPSAVIQQEFNYVMDITHPDFQKIKFARPKPFNLDTRILQTMKEPSLE